MSICYDFVLDLIAAIKNKPYNMNKFAKNGLLSSSLYTIILLYTKKRYQGKILDTFSGAEGETRQGKPCLACFASFPISCPFCFAKDGLSSSSLSYLFCYTQRKGIKEKSLIPFLARKERLDRASPVLLASQTPPIFCPFCFAKDGLLSSSLSPSISFAKKEKAQR